MNNKLLILPILFLNFAVWAQESENPSFATDRPNQTEASSVVPRGFYQLEIGYEYQKDRQGGVEQKTYQHPQAVLRTGVTQNIEFRLQGTYQQQEDREAGQFTQQIKGFTQLRVGTKVHLVENKGMRPEIAVLAMAELPWGIDASKPDGVAPEVRLLLSNALSPKVSIGYNVGYRREKGDGQMENKLQYSVTVGGKVSQKIQVFGEFFGDKTKGSPVENQVDGGLLFLVLPNVQLDVVVGTRASSQAQEMFAGGGLSIRLPR